MHLPVPSRTTHLPPGFGLLARAVEERRTMLERRRPVNFMFALLGLKREDEIGRNRKVNLMWAEGSVGSGYGTPGTVGNRVGFLYSSPPLPRPGCIQ